MRSSGHFSEVRESSGLKPKTLCILLGSWPQEGAGERKQEEWDCNNVRIWLKSHQIPTIHHDNIFTMFLNLIFHEEVPFYLPLHLALSAKITLL